MGHLLRRGNTTNDFYFSDNITVDKFDHVFLAGRTNAGNAIPHQTANQQHTVVVATVMDF